MQHPAAAPEGRRGVPLSRPSTHHCASGCARPRSPPREAVGYTSCGTVEFLLAPGRLVLLPRDEHPSPGRAPGDRRGLGCRPGRDHDPHRAGRALPLDRARPRAARPRRSSAASTPRIRAARLRAVSRAGSRRCGCRRDPGSATTSAWSRAPRVPIDYDPMLGKLVVHGPDRPAALSRLAARALRLRDRRGRHDAAALSCARATTPEFRAARFDVQWLDRRLAEGLLVSETESLRRGPTGRRRRPGRARRRSTSVRRRAIGLALEGGGAPRRARRRRLMRRFRFIHRAADAGRAEETRGSKSTAAVPLLRAGSDAGPPRRRAPGRTTLAALRGRPAGLRRDAAASGRRRRGRGRRPRPRRRKIALAEPLRDRIAHAREESARRPGADEEIRALMPGRVVEVAVAEGASVSAGALILVLEAMKMQNEIRCSRRGHCGATRRGAGRRGRRRNACWPSRPQELIRGSVLPFVRWSRCRLLTERSVIQ